ncbi:MAG TPA: hypothetical protein PKH72_08875, partial [Rhodoferax sp.]|nr:hypothetical protein [Rhodoferax sp.]
MYLTRNQAYRKVPWVRIPLSPPQAHVLHGLFGFWGFLCQGALSSDLRQIKSIALSRLQLLAKYLLRM